MQAQAASWRSDCVRQLPFIIVLSFLKGNPMSRHSRNAPTCIAAQVRVRVSYVHGIPTDTEAILQLVPV